MQGLRNVAPTLEVMVKNLPSTFSAYVRDLHASPSRTSKDTSPPSDDDEAAEVKRGVAELFDATLVSMRKNPA